MLARLASVSLAFVLVALLAGPSLAQQSPAETPPASGSPSPAPPAPASPPAAPPTAQPPPTASSEQGTPAIVLSPEESEGIIGKNVRSAAGEDMGRIVDIIVSASNQPRAAVIDFGGFLGVGSRKIAVDWRLLQYSRTGKTWGVTSALTRNQVRGSPEYKPGEPVVVLGLPAVQAPAPTAQGAMPAAQAPASGAAPAPQPTPQSPAAPAQPPQPPINGSGAAPANNPGPSTPPASANPSTAGPSSQEGAGERSRPPQ